MSLSVQYHTDKHVVKMPLESTQLLCNALHISDSAPEWIYRPTHLKHPCSLWAAESLDNWRWLREFTIKLGEEYTYRYGKTHASMEMAKRLPEPNITNFGLTPFAKAVPQEFKSLPVVEAYREYFIAYKQHLKHYTKRKVPDWWV